MDTASPRLRMSVIGVVVIGCFAALFAAPSGTCRSWRRRSCEVQATANRTRTVAVEAPRGRILDRNGKVIVDNKTSLVVTVDRPALKKFKQPDRDALVSKLAGVFTQFGTPTKVETIEERLADLQYDDLQPVPVATGIGRTSWCTCPSTPTSSRRVDVTRESVRDYKYPRVRRQHPRLRRPHQRREVQGRPARHRPQRRGEDLPARLHHRPGRGGGQLRAGPAGHAGHRDPGDRLQGPAGRPVSYQAPQPGSDIQLNIDIDLQIKAEDTLRQQLDAAPRRPPGRPEAATDQEGAGGLGGGERSHQRRRDGAGHLPHLQARRLRQRHQHRGYAELSDTNGISALVNRSITGQYAPGSTFKLVSATAALDNGVITPGRPIDDKGVFSIGNSGFDSTGKNGPDLVTNALTVSSDVLFYRLGYPFWSGRPTKVQDTGRQPSGATRPPASTCPTRPPAWSSPRWRRTRCTRSTRWHTPATTTWYTGDSAQLAIGQGVLGVTPIQLANAYATLANGRHRVPTATSSPRCSSPAAPPTCPSPAPIRPASCGSSTPSCGPRSTCPTAPEAIVAGLAGVTPHRHRRRRLRRLQPVQLPHPGQDRHRPGARARPTTPSSPVPDRRTTPQVRGGRGARAERLRL